MITNRISGNEIIQVVQDKTRRITCTNNLMMATWEFSNGPWEISKPPHFHPHEQFGCGAEEVIIYIKEKSWHRNSGDSIDVSGGLLHSSKRLTSTVHTCTSMWHELL